MEGLGRIPDNIRLELANSKERDDVAKNTGSWSHGYDYGKSDMIQESDGHYSDSGKLPWHPTFSDESAYSSHKFKGGTWSTPEGSMTGNIYTPSRDMIKAGTTEGLSEYMKSREPDVQLNSPEGYEIIDGQFVKINGLGDVSMSRYKVPIKTYGGVRG